MKERANRILKWADRYLGIPMVCALGAAKATAGRHQPPPLMQHSRILVLKTAGIGDTILLSSIIAELKQAFPHTEITVVCAKNNNGAVQGIGGVDNTILLNLSNPISTLAEVMHSGPFDVLLDFAPWARINAVLSFFARAKVKVGFRTKGECRHFVYDVAVEHSAALHELDNYRALLKAIGIPLSNLPPHFSIADEAMSSATRIANGFPYIVFHPFSGGSRKGVKEWRDSRWIELGTVLIKRGYRIIITGGTEDTERADYIARSIAVDEDLALSIAGRCSLQETAAVIKGAEVLISVDTGVMHLGAAVGQKVISLHGPTSPLRWGPVGSTALSLTTTFQCSPCISLGFEKKCKGGGCMDDITVTQVLNAVEAILR